jgi:hypothetical protein
VGDLALHHQPHLAGGGFVLAGEPPHFEAGANWRKRVAQLVREHRQELVFPSIGVTQLLLAVAQGFFSIAAFALHPDALGQVTHETRKPRRTAGIDERGDRNLDREFVSVGMEPARLDAAIEKRALARSQVMLQPAPMLVAQIFGNHELGQLLANHIGLGMAEHALGRGIELGDDAAVIHRDHAVERGIDNRAHPPLRGLLLGNRRAEQQRRRSQDTGEYLQQRQPITGIGRTERTIARDRIHDGDCGSGQHRQRSGRLTGEDCGGNHEREQHVVQRTVADHRARIAAEHHGGERHARCHGHDDADPTARPSTAQRTRGRQDHRSDHQRAKRIADPPGQPQIREAAPRLHGGGAQSDDADGCADRGDDHGAEEDETRRITDAREAGIEPRAAKQPHEGNRFKRVAGGDRAGGP